MNSKSLNPCDFDPHFICAITFPDGVWNFKNGVFCTESPFCDRLCIRKAKFIPKCTFKEIFLALALSFQDSTHYGSALQTKGMDNPNKGNGKNPKTSALKPVSESFNSVFTLKATEILGIKSIKSSHYLEKAVKPAI